MDMAQTERKLAEGGSMAWLRGAWRLLPWVFILTLGGCGANSPAPFPPAGDEPTKMIHVVSHGWHAGIVVRRGDISGVDWPELAPLREADYLEIGWGDKEYYTSPNPGWLLGARALLLPTVSVLHIVGMRSGPKASFPTSEIVEIRLTVAGFERLMARVSQSFSRDASGAAIDAGPGLYGSSRFYVSGESYHALKTCNTWTAEVLRAAGCPVRPTLTVNGLMRQLRRIGEVVGRREKFR